MNGQLLTSMHNVNCWGCGAQILKGEKVFQGEDDQNYGPDCCADLSDAQIALNYAEWAEFKGVAR